MAEVPIIMRFRSLVASVVVKARKVSDKLSTPQLYLIGAIILLASLGFGAVMVALDNALFFNGFAEDGAFQLLNPLRRIVEQGQVIGRDFNFFHGVGTPLLHLPSYLLFGQGMFGEEMTRWLVSPLFFVLSTFCFFYIFRRNFIFALSMSAGVTVIAMIIVPFIVLPITSILGVRSVLPVFVMVVVLSQKRLGRFVTRKGPQWLRLFTWYELIVGALLAVSVVCGTEFGLAAIIAFFIVHLAYRIDPKQSWRARVPSALRVLGVLIVSLFALLSVITLGHPFAPLRYAFIDIPADQCWYFGVPPNTFLHLGNLWHVLTSDPLLLVMFGITALAALSVWRMHRIQGHRVETQAFMFGLLAGAFAMVSMLGYFSSTEAAALTRMALLVGGATLTVLFERWRKPIAAGGELGRFKVRLKIRPAVVWRAVGALFVAVSLVCCVVVVTLVKQNYDIFKTLRRAVDYVSGVDTNSLGGRWIGVDETIIPVIQADNNVSIVDVNSDGFEHGVNSFTKQVIVDVGDRGSFVRHGQIVYLEGAGRQIISKATTAGGSRVVVTLQNKKAELNPAVDGAPNKLIVAEDFNHDDKKVWSLYTGLLNQEMGLVHPSNGGYDYIIHALGKQRREEYVNDFKSVQPEFVVGFARSYFVWEDWIENEHWDFYALLDKNYEVVRESSIYALWKRKDQPWSNDAYSQVSWQPLVVDAKEDKITLQKPSFDGAPDIETFGQELIQRERDRQVKMGRPVGQQNPLNEDQYYEYLFQRMREDRQLSHKQAESRGPESDVQESKLNAKRARDSAAQTGPTLHIPKPKRLVVLVKLKYEAKQPMSWIPLLGRTTRFIGEMNNTYSKTPISLRPYANETIFPVVISELNDDPYIRFKTKSLLPGGGSLKIIGAQYTVLDTSIENLKLLTD